MSESSDPRFDLDVAPIYLPLFGSRAEMADLHWRYNRFVLHAFRGRGRLLLLGRGIAWPFRALHRVYRATLKHGAFVKERTGKSPLRQFVEHAFLVLGRGLPPNSYHRFQLFDDERRAIAGEYLHRYETRPFLARLLNRDGDRSLLSSKLRFFKHCRAHGLRTPKVYAKFPRAEPGKPITLPGRDLLSKPRRGKGGRRVTRWTYRDGLYEGPDGLRFDTPGLIGHLNGLAAKEEPLLLQKLVTNHRSIQDLGNGVLTTLRIMTCRNLEGVPEAVCGVFRMPVESDSVDTFHSGGIASAVDMDTGRLSAAISVKARSARYQRHPRRKDSRIAGRALPHFQAAKELACRAHEAFGGFVVVGWDLGLTTKGPILIEGNANIDVDLVQRPHGEPIGKMLLGRYLAHHFQRISREDLAGSWHESGRKP